MLLCLALLLLFCLLRHLLGFSNVTLVLPIFPGTHGHTSSQTGWDVRLLLSGLLVDLVVEVGLARPRLNLVVTDPVYAIYVASMLLHQMVLGSLARYGALPLGHTIHVFHWLAPLFMPARQLSRHGDFLQSFRILSPDSVRGGRALLLVILILEELR